MTTRSSSSSSSSSSESELRSGGRVREISETSRETGSRIRAASPTNTIEGTSIADTATLRSASPTASHTSAAVSRTNYETASIATTLRSAGTNATAVSGQQQQSTTAGGIPIIRPPVLQQQQLSGTEVGVFGPQRPAGYPVQPPAAANQQGIRIDVAAAQQQYQQRNVQAEVSPYSSSSVTSSGGSLSSPGTASIQQQQQPHFDVKKAMFNQADTNKDGSLSREEFQKWAQGGMNRSGGQAQQQQQQQQAQFPNQIPAHEVYNELLGPDAFKDVILDIDYGALGAFNVPFHTGGDFSSGGQLPPGISIRPAYNTVDSLNYQQHMFNTARTVHVGGENNNYDYGGASNNYDYGAANNAYNYSDAQQYNAGGGQHFDVAKAIFNQADTNRDGGISRDEFQNWAQGGQQGYNAQTYSSSASYGGASDGVYQASLFAGADPSVANILQQSGLGQVVPN